MGAGEMRGRNGEDGWEAEHCRELFQGGSKSRDSECTLRACRSARTWGSGHY